MKRRREEAEEARPTRQESQSVETHPVVVSHSKLYFFRKLIEQRLRAREPGSSKEKMRGGLLPVQAAAAAAAAHQRPRIGLGLSRVTRDVEDE